MAWSPKYIDRPLRFLYDPEVWGISFILMGFLMVCGANQTVSLAVSVVFGALVQRVVDHHKNGYILHMLYRAGLLKLFCSYGKYRF
jgi:hypothetical protein